MRLIKNKGFTLIELLVTIAVLSILVLLGIPRLTSYVQEAQLTRIQHDVKVIEQEMSNVLTTDNNFNEWQNNGKDLSRVIMRKELYEKQGVAKNLDWEHLSAKWLRADKDANQLANKNNELSVGGDLIELDDKYSTYKIIPKEYSSKTNTKLKGTFYVNSLGKVYYEHDKSLGKAIDKEVLACVAPSTLGYEFKIISDLGTITGWNGNATHLVIPAAFKMSDGDKEWCEPVRVIGAGAFQNGTFKRVTIPQSVEEIQEEAFQGGELIEIEIPHSVKTVDDNAFTDNPATGSGGTDGSGGNGSRVIVKGSSDPSSGRDISDSAFGGLKPNYSHVTDKDLGVIIKTKNNDGKTVSIVGKTVTSDSSSGDSNTVINIPKELEIDGEILPVTEIEKGAFQGSGLIDVIMPEGLLYIHDYAFAGNQLVRAVIPNSVIEVGNYAFAYNEIASEPTIDPINILKDKLSGSFEDVNNEGNISKPVISINLKDHIFIISPMGNHVIEDIGANPEQSEDNNDKDVNNKVELMNPIDPRNPIKGEIPIATAEELAKIGQPEYPLNGKYILTDNIDLSHIDWTPIGTGYSSRFTGSFDGNGYKVTGLTIDKPSRNFVGLFGYTSEAIISNVPLENINVTGKGHVGGLVGYATNSTISNSYTTGTVTGTGSYVGGLAGTTHYGTDISNSYTTGSVTGSGDRVGGFVGYVYVSTNISNAYSTGSVTGWSEVGGLVGRAESSTIENSYATGEVTGLSKVGGLVGFTDSSTMISNSYATGSVKGSVEIRAEVGGLVGVATNSTTISNSYATGSVTGRSFSGGLVGSATESSIIENSYATGSVEGQDSVGCLVGHANRITIKNSYATGKVEGTGSLGGLVGLAYDSMISNSYATGSVTGSSEVGGLVGWASESTEIINSYATGEVTGGSKFVGGLVGLANHNTTISNSYATGSVTGKDKVGGLVGGASSNTKVTSSYWDKETARQSTSAGGVGMTTDEMKLKGTYLGWDFVNVWKIDEGNGYPKLR